MPYNYDREQIFYDTGKPYFVRGVMFDKEEIRFLRNFCNANETDLSAVVNEAMDIFFDRFSDVENIFSCLSYNFAAYHKWDGIEYLYWFPWHGLQEGVQTSVDLSMKNYSKLKLLKYYFKDLEPVKKDFKKYNDDDASSHYYRLLRNTCGKSLTKLEKYEDKIYIGLPKTESGWIRLIVRTVIISSCGFVTRNPGKNYLDGKYKKASKDYYCWYIIYILNNTDSEIMKRKYELMNIKPLDLKIKDGSDIKRKVIDEFVNYCDNDISVVKELYRKHSSKEKRKKE